MKNEKQNGYQDLIVWQKSMRLAGMIYILTRQFPREEQFGITNQMRRSAVSIPSNISEGYGRGSVKEFKHFLLIAYGSTLELETQLLLSEQIGFVQPAETHEAKLLVIEISKMLNKMSK